LRELLDKKLWNIPEHIKDKAAYEEKINDTLRSCHPKYWRSRENGRISNRLEKYAPVGTNEDR